MACSTTWQILTTTIGMLKQLYERFSPHIDETFLNYKRGTFHRVSLILARINGYLLIINKSHELSL